MGFQDSAWKSYYLFQGSGPSSAITFTASDAREALTLPLVGPTNVGGLLVGLAQESVCVVVADLVGATGGVTDWFIQSSVDAKQDGTGTWYDVIHFAQLAAGAASQKFVATICRGFNKIAAAPNVTGDSSTGASALAVATIIPDGLGNALRVVAIGGAGTTLGAAQRIKLGLSK